MSLKNLSLKRKYRSSSDMLLEDFYKPVLQKTSTYKRAVGYFSSNVLVYLINALEPLVRNEGSISLIISPFISVADAETFLNMASGSHEYVNLNLDKLFMEFKEKSKTNELAAKILVALLEKGIMTMKVALPQNKSGMFHEKLAIFYDSEYNIVATNGSNNETESALRHNLESFNVFCSWKTGHSDFILDHENDFDGYWNNRISEVETIDLYDAVSQKVFEEYSTEHTIDELYEEYNYTRRPMTAQNQSDLTFTPYPFQKEAVDEWFKVKKGIFKMATGTGKTKTAIYLMNQYYKESDKGAFIIVVPDKTLVVQWSEELFENNLDPIKCYSDNASNWKRELHQEIDEYTMNLSNKLVVVVTKDSFSSPFFQKQIRKLKSDFVFVGDECHRLGTDNLLEKLPDAVAKLGLSATPEIYFSEERTDKLMTYFGGIIVDYGLKEAIRDGFLAKYEYHPVIVRLNDEEKEEYDKWTRKIIRALNHDDEAKVKEIDKEIEQLFFNRARIVYGAEEKISKVRELAPKLSEQKHLLIYCGATQKQYEPSEEITEARNQLQIVNDTLTTLDIKAAQYTQSENGKVRKDSISLFKKGVLSTLVAIRCLDEGVNIPEIKQAIILASSGNPREFVQRRGRLLRKTEDKNKAIIYDMVVFSDDESYQSINRVELKRVKEFSELATNHNDIYTKFSNYYDQYLKEEIIDDK